MGSFWDMISNYAGDIYGGITDLFSSDDVATVSDSGGDGMFDSLGGFIDTVFTEDNISMIGGAADFVKELYGSEVEAEEKQLDRESTLEIQRLRNEGDLEQAKILAASNEKNARQSALASALASATSAGNQRLSTQVDQLSQLPNLIQSGGAQRVAAAQNTGRLTQDGINALVQNLQRAKLG